MQSTVMNQDSPNPQAGGSLAQGLASVRPADAVEVMGRPAIGTRSIAVLVVTWNRKQPLDHQLKAVARQSYPVENLDVIIVDNSSTDGTLESLQKNWKPELVVINDAKVAHEPAFRTPANEANVGARTRTNAGGFRSLTVVRNANNFGGCGGFNTGFAFIERYLEKNWDNATAGAKGKPDYVWLVDDDAEVAPRTLEHMLRAAEADDKIGLVGSRTVDWHNRNVTIESTIYMDIETGRMGDQPAPGHRLFESHKAWAEKVGGPKGANTYTGVREVDVASACCLLGRWSAVREVGYWDYRYFIYCDDADWGLRFPKHGYKVVCCLDAEVYHTPWLMKLTPARLYYAQRNVVWMIQKIIPRERIRMVTFKWLVGFLKEAAKAVWYRRLFHSEIMRRTADDICTGKWGKLDYEGPAAEGICEGLDRIGALRSDQSIALIINRPGMVDWADELRGWITNHLAVHNRSADIPKFLYIIRNDIPDPTAGLIDPHNALVQPERIVYSHRLRSKIFRQKPLLLDHPRAAVIWDQVNDFPLLRATYNVHIDRKAITRAQIERGGQVAKLKKLVKIGITAGRVVLYSFVRPFVVNTSKFGSSGKGARG